jgi:transposase
MIYVGIDVAKDKHDCFITNSDGEVLFKAFAITNNLEGFNDLYQKVESVIEDITKVKVGLEATGHYSYNLLGYLVVYVMLLFRAPLHGHLLHLVLF